MKNKQLANRILLLTAGLFICLAVLKHIDGHCFFINLLLAVSEAALVGSIADWFAITALFDEPLGFKWHTRLIPNNRKKFINGTVTLVQEELLSPQCLKQKVSNIWLTGNIIQWIDCDNGKKIITSLFKKKVLNYLENLDSEQVTRYLEKVLNTYGDKINLAHIVHEFFQFAVRNLQDERVINYILNESIKVLQRPAVKKQLCHMLEQENTSGHQLKNVLLSLLQNFDIINYEAAGTALQQTLIAVLDELKKPQHPLRLWFKEQLNLTLLQLATDKKGETIMNDWKNELLQHVFVRNFLIRQIDLIKHKKQPIIVAWLLQELDKYWYTFKASTTMQHKVEEYLQEAMARIIDSEHVFIGLLVKKAFHSFSEEDLNQFVIAKAGNDLQWIRINGALVGSVVGLSLFLFLQFVYYPLVVPMIRNAILV